MEVNIGDVARRHRERIPNGRLCAAGRAKYAAFDLPGAWPATRLRAGADGRYTIRYRATAPHATRYFRYYLTKPGFDPRTDRLGWDDLRLVHDSGPLPAQSSYPFRMRLPARTGRSILYVVWQRSDSPEAFYGCSDVVLGSTPAAPARTTPATPAPATSVPKAPRARVRTRVVDDWGSGYCARGTVVNPSRRPLAWKATIAVRGRITSNWDSVMTRLGTRTGGVTRVRVRGAAWNAALRGRARTTFGYCVTRPAR